MDDSFVVRIVSSNRQRVWLNGSPLPKPKTVPGATEKTRAFPAPCWKCPSPTSKCQKLPYLRSHASASSRSLASSDTRTASPSTTRSYPLFQVLVPVVSTTLGFSARLRALRSSGPVQKCSAPSDHTVGRGVTCGRPSGRTVEIQNSSDSASSASASDQGRAVAVSSL